MLGQEYEAFCHHSANSCPTEFGFADVGFVLDLTAAGTTYAALVIDSLWTLLVSLGIACTCCKRPLRTVKMTSKKNRVSAEQGAQEPPVSAPVASEAQLAEVAKDVSAELQKLELQTVSLDLMRRKIDLLKGLDFMGHKSEGGAGAFKDPVAAKQICAEAAIAIAAVNKQLKERGLKQVGLSIEGHSSGGSGDATLAKQTSMIRAKSTKSALKAALSGLEDLDAPPLESHGFGAEQPLKGFDDGGNYDQNRRVEFRITM